MKRATVIRVLFLLLIGTSAGRCEGALSRPVLPAALWDREFQKVEKDNPAYSPIGIITTGQNDSTAFLVAPCYVLTTYHTLFGQGAIDPARAFQFNVGRPDNEAADFKDGTAAKPVVLGDYATAPHRTCEDFALLRLNRCLGDTYGYIVLAPFSIGQILELQNTYNKVVKSAGYPRSEEFDEISVDEGVVHGPHVSDEEALAHTCNAMGGSSGGPLFFELPASGRLIAFGIMNEVITIPGALSDNSFLTGEDREEPTLFNKAAPVTCFYDRIREYLPPTPPQ